MQALHNPMDTTDDSTFGIGWSGAGGWTDVP